MLLPFTVFFFSTYWHVRLLSTLPGIIARQLCHLKMRQQVLWLDWQLHYLWQYLCSSVALFFLQSVLLRNKQQEWTAMVQGNLRIIGRQDLPPSEEAKGRWRDPLSSPWQLVYASMSACSQPVGLVRVDSLCGFCRGQSEVNVQFSKQTTPLAWSCLRLSSMGHCQSMVLQSTTY